MSNNFLIKKIGVQSEISLVLVPAALDSMTAYDLLERILSLANGKPTKIIINLEDVEYISSTGIEMLYRLQRELFDQHVSVLVTNVPEKIFNLLEKVGVTTLLDITDSLEQAVEQLTA